MDISSLVHGLAAVVTVMGDPRFWLLLGLLLLTVLTFFRKARGKTMVSAAEFVLFKAFPLIIIAFGSAVVLEFLLKIPRPCEGLSVCPSTYSFPSAHATVAFAIFTFLGLAGKKVSKKRFLLMLIPACLVAWSRIELGMHEPIDVIGGAVLGTLVGIAYSAFWKSRKKVVAAVKGRILSATQKKTSR